MFGIGSNLSDAGTDNPTRANSEFGTEQRSPGRPQEQDKDKRQHQESFAESGLRTAFMVDIEQQRHERSHFSTLEIRTPKLTPNIRRPLATTTPTATQRRTADRE
jgi:hypothetical protein